MLWNTVFEFFVKYIFGGVLYVNGNSVGYVGTLGRVFNNTTATYSAGDTGLAYFAFGIDNQYIIPMGNYFSLIATIITMIVILVLCCQLIKKIYNICAHVIA